MNDKTGTSQIVVMSPSAVAGVYDAGVANPDDWMWEAFGGGNRSDSDIYVTAEKALTFGPWFQGISIISGDCARVACDVFERDEDDDRIKHRDHEAWEVLNRRANRRMSAFILREELFACALSWGHGYAVIRREGNRIAELIPLLPEVTEEVVLPSGDVVFQTDIGNGEKRVYQDSDVLHIKGIGGKSVFKLAKNAIGAGLAAERHGNRFFKNDAKPGIVLKTAAKLSKQDADALLDAWEARHGQNPNRPALATHGLEPMPFPISNEDAQFIDSRKFQREDIASFLCLPPHKLGSDARLSYNSVEAEERSYVSQTLMRWFKRFESEADLKLLNRSQQRAWWYIEHNTAALIQGDFATQSKVAVDLKNAMIITRNEARKKFNLNSVDGGDEFENANTSTDKGDTEEPPENREALDAHLELMEHRMWQLTKSEVSQLKNLTKKANYQAQAIDKWYTGFAAKIAEALAPCLRAYRTLTTCKLSAASIAAKYCRSSQETIMELLTTITPDQLSGAMIATVGDWPDTRPKQVIQWIREG